MLTMEDIEGLRLDFDFNGHTMYEWFGVTRTSAYCHIQSGLNHADGKTKSPYHYDRVTFGDGAIDEAAEIFNEWFYDLPINKLKRRKETINKVLNNR